MQRAELAGLVLGPNFDAVRDTFAVFSPAPGVSLGRLRKVGMRVDPSVHDTDRHFAACREDGRRILLAPELAEEDIDTVTAVLAHEFGHAADFLWPAHWVAPERGKPAVWLGDLSHAKLAEERERGRAWARLWADRSADQIEWTADAIAHAVIGRPLLYCGDRLLQCLHGGVARPTGLR